MALHLSEIVGFAIADRETRSIFALFVLPAFAGRGIGSHLLDLATDWLWGEAASRIWLTTRQGTKAASFYKQKGWKAVDLDPLGNIRYELEPPSGRTTS